MSTRLILRIQDRIGRLTRSEHRLANVLLDRPTLIETHTATDLARLSGVSKATAARFFRTLGYRDFEEVKLQARDERNLTQPYSYSVSASTEAALGRTIGEHLKLELDNITRTFEEMGSDKLRKAAAMIQDAPRLWFLGSGADGWMARYGRRTFARLRHNVHVLGLDFVSLPEDLAMTGPRDVMIAALAGAQPRGLEAVLSYARTSRTRIITLTDYGSFARARRHSDIVLPCHIANYGQIPSHTAMLSTLRLLAIAFAGAAGETATQRIGLIDDISEELDMTD